MSSTTPGPRTGRTLSIGSMLRHVTSLSERRLQRCLERNAVWVEQARNAPTVGEQMGMYDR
jgi:hypothetical protein